MALLPDLARSRRAVRTVGVQVHRQRTEVRLQLLDRLAPTTAVETTGLRSSQASATSAGLAPISRHSAFVRLELVAVRLDAPLQVIRGAPCSAASRTPASSPAWSGL